jgi:transposase-like protein
MSQNVPLQDTKRERAAHLLAENDKTTLQIADEIGVNRKTLARWQQDAAFAFRVEQLRKAFFDKLNAKTEASDADRIRRKEWRVNQLQSLADRMQLIIDERQAAMSGELEKSSDDGSLTMVRQYPGGASGLLARSYDKFGNEILKFDAALARELSNTYKQAAQELGQWTEKAEVDIGGEVKIIKVPAKLSHDEWSAEAWETPEKAI